MGKIFFISDLHFGCANQHDGRTFEHDYIIKEKWNNVVTNADTVYILGDIGREGSNKDNEYLCQIISTLRGKKILIQGNHEKLKDIRLRQLFTEVHSQKEISIGVKGVNYNLVLSHTPMLMWNGQHKGWIHLYGHLHMSEEWNIYDKSLQMLNRYFLEQRKAGRTDCPAAEAYNVGAMLPYMDNEPKTIDEIIRGANQFYIERYFNSWSDEQMQEFLNSFENANGE